MFDLLAHVTLTYLLYLLYGAAFLFLGVSIAAKDMKGSNLKLANILWLLGMFGFLHGAHEWLVLGPLIEKENLALPQVLAVLTLALAAVVLSFVFLLLFGLSLLVAIDDKWKPLIKSLPPILFFVWSGYLFYYGSGRQEGFHVDLEYLRHGAIAARLIFGFIGGMVTAYGLAGYAKELRLLNRPASQKLRNAGIAFVFYAVFAGLFSSHIVLPFVHVPVELLRGISASLITYFIVNALNIFDIEARHKIEGQMRRIIQVEKLSSLGQLAAGIAHEINNPLTNASLGIERFKQKVKKCCGDPDAMERLNAIERNIDKASVIARELLQFSRQRDSESVPCDVGAVLNGALTLLQHKLVNITVHHSPSDGIFVMGDSLKLEQVFINILSNAIEAMPHGGEITLGTSVKGGKVDIRISDTGSGISQEHLERVFDPFFTTKEIGVGTGLGLSLCYGIVAQHHGSIEVSSTSGKGTTVSVKIPTRDRYGELYEKNSDR